MCRPEDGYLIKNICEDKLYYIWEIILTDQSILSLHLLSIDLILREDFQRNKEFSHTGAENSI